jgi:hypothetical protein
VLLWRSSRFGGDRPRGQRPVERRIEPITSWPQNRVAGEVLSLSGAGYLSGTALPSSDRDGIEPPCRSIGPAWPPGIHRFATSGPSSVHRQISVRHGSLSYRYCRISQRKRAAPEHQSYGLASHPGELFSTGQPHDRDQSSDPATLSGLHSCATGLSGHLLSDTRASAVPAYSAANVRPIVAMAVPACEIHWS